LGVSVGCVADSVTASSFDGAGVSGSTSTSALAPLSTVVFSTSFAVSVVLASVFVGCAESALISASGVLILFVDADDEVDVADVVDEPVVDRGVVEPGFAESDAAEFAELVELEDELDEPDEAEDPEDEDDDEEEPDDPESESSAHATP
jgi:hypothetical protein